MTHLDQMTRSAVAESVQRFDPTLPKDNSRRKYVSLKYLARKFEISIHVTRKYLIAENVLIEKARRCGYKVLRVEAEEAIKRQIIPPDGTIRAKDFVIMHPRYRVKQISSIVDHRRVPAFRVAGRTYFFEKDMIAHLRKIPTPRKPVPDSIEGHRRATGLSDDLVRKAMRFHEVGIGSPVKMSRRCFVLSVKTYLYHLNAPGSPMHQHAMECHLFVSRSNSGKAAMKFRSLVPLSWLRFCSEKLTEDNSYVV